MMRFCAMRWVILSSLVGYALSDCSVVRDDGVPLTPITGDAGIDPVARGTIEVDPNPRRPSCGKRRIFFDSSQFTCCGGVVNKHFSRFRDDWVRCCGQTPYDSRRFFCCEENNLKNGRIQPGKICCGTRFIDPNRQICCGGRAHSKKPNLKCCGTRSYDKTQKVCCIKPNGQFVSRNGNACCVGTPFDNSGGNKVCCDGYVKNAPSGPVESYKCCKNRPYAHTQQICCNRAIMSKSIKPAENFCCAGQRERLTRDNADTFGNLGCCARTRYDIRLRECCNNQLVSKASLI